MVFRKILKLRKPTYAIIILAIFSVNKYLQVIAYNSYKSWPADARIMSYNIAIGAHDVTISPEARKDSLYSIIKSINPDIICLQECSRWHIRGFEQLIKEEYPYEAHSYNMYSKLEVINTTVLQPDTTSREYRILKNEHSELFYSSRNTGILYCADIKLADNIVRVINVRLASNNVSTMRESSNAGKIRSALRNYSYGKKLRYLQVRTICKVIEESPYPVILCGDMNDISGSSTIKDIINMGLKDAWWDSGNGYGATYSDRGLALRIDYVLHSKAIESLQSNIYETSFSDHLPLVVDFRIR